MGSKEEMLAISQLNHQKSKKIQQTKQNSLNQHHSKLPKNHPNLTLTIQKEKAIKMKTLNDDFII
ncbi:MAG: hypothetical protein MI865_03655, partial [Proteobacteria bacterium]|nr:hypothetical protein [Pseudomonadota bacterium]